MPELVKLSAKVDTVRNLLDRMKPQLALALPKHLTADRLVRVVYTEVLTSIQRARPGAPTLVDCTGESFASAVLQAAELGLLPGGLGQVHLIPRRNNRRGTVECTFQLGYKGILTLVRRSGQILTISPVVVYARDRYDVRKGTTRSIRHEPYRSTGAGDTPGEAVAFYAVADIRGGGTQFEDMSRADVEAHRDRYAATRGEASPWDTHFEAMALKTVLKKLCKYLPVEVEAAEAIRLDDAAETGRSQIFSVDLPDWIKRENPADPALEESASAPADGSAKLDAAVARRRGVEREEPPARSDPEAAVP